MAIHDYLTRFVDTEEGRIVAANAAAGIELRVHSPDVVKAFFKDAFAAGGSSDGIPHEEFFRLMEDVCFARAHASHIYLGLSRHGKDYQYAESQFSVVWPVEALNRLASPQDHRRFTGLTGIVPDPATGCASWATEIARLNRNERYFRLDPAKSFGNTLIWFTLTSIIDSIISAPPEADRTKADVCRDRAGLIHRQPKMILVAFHIPGSVLEKVRHFRPTFIEANSHARFSVRARDFYAVDDDPYGRTVDLKYFAEDLNLCDGVPERVALPFNSANCEAGDVITFDILDKLNISRGKPTPPDTHCRDDTAAFSTAIRGNQTDTGLVNLIA